MHFSTANFLFMVICGIVHPHAFFVSSQCMWYCWVCASNFNFVYFFSGSITNARIALKNLGTLTYNFQECNDKHAQDLAQHLEELYTQYYEYLPNKDGLVIRPRCQVALQNIRRKLHRRRVSLKCSALLKWLFTKFKLCEIEWSWAKG